MAERRTLERLTQISVRVDPASPATRRLQLPLEPNTVATGGGRRTLWLGPDEWLVVGEAGTEGTIQRALADALRASHHSIVDVSANRIAFDLTDGLDLLSTGCGLDLDPTRWFRGMCAQTLFGQAQVILHQLDERTTRVFVRPSFAGYFVDRLGAAVS
jgi:sarcosine oxidase subunit gamma